MTREELEAEYGEVLTTDDVREKYEVRSFLAPLVFVTDLKTGKRGTLQFQHMPRFYFDWREDTI